MRSLLLVCLFTIFQGNSSLGQLQPDYPVVDQLAREHASRVSDIHAPDSLLRWVNARFPLPEEKIRFVFSWIATHLEYDCGSELRGSPSLHTLDDILRTGRSACEYRYRVRESGDYLLSVVLDGRNTALIYRVLSE